MTGRTRSNAEVMKRLVKLIHPLRGTMVLAVTMGVLGNLCAILIPVLGAAAILQAIRQGNGTGPAVYYVTLPLLAVLRGTLHYLEQNRNHFLAFKLLALVRDKVFGALRKLAPAKLEGRDKGDLIAVLTADIELLEVFYAHTISPICIAAIVTVIMTAIIGRYHFWLGLYALLSYCVIGIVVPVIAAKRSRKMGEAFRKKFGALDAFVLESLRGVKESIQYHAGEKRLNEIVFHSDALSEEEKKLKGEAGTSAALTGGIILLLDTGMLLLSITLYQQGNINFEGVLLPVIALMSSFGPAIALANLGTGLQNTFAAGNRVLDILDEKPETEEQAHGKNVTFNGAKCEDVGFSYDQEAILQNISLELSQNSIIGITGKSGSGKSTLLKLMMRFWDVKSGRISISNEDIKNINTESLRENEGLVTQDTQLFHDSIRRNLMLANPKATEDQMIDACKRASVHDFIMTLPNGYDTLVSELGDNLSGGERQRLGLARAFLHQAPLLLLDEPTSNLDSLNEAMILKSLRESRDNRTIVLVSHRTSTMRIADRVYSVENGRMS